MSSLYKMVTETKPPKWLGDAGDKAYEGMDNAFKYLGGKRKKKKKADAVAESEKKKNAMDI